DAGAGGEGGEVTGLHPVELAVDPGVDLAGDDEGELLLARLGVGPGAAGPGEEAHDVEPDAAHAGGAAGGARGGHLAGAVGVAVPGLGDVGCGDDEWGSARHGASELAPTEPPARPSKRPERPADRPPDNPLVTDSGRCRPRNVSSGRRGPSLAVESGTWKG